MDKEQAEKKLEQKTRRRGRKKHPKMRVSGRGTKQLAQKLAQRKS